MATEKCSVKLLVKEIENLLDEAFSGKVEVFCRDCNKLIPFDWDNTYCYTCLLAKKDVSSNSEENLGLLDVYKCNEKGKLPNWYLGY